MLATIDLDHQPPPIINEVRYERADWRLPAEMSAHRPVHISQTSPNLSLLRSHLGAKLAGSAAGDGADAAHAGHRLGNAPHPDPPHEGEG